MFSFCNRCRFSYTNTYVYSEFLKNTFELISHVLDYGGSALKILAIYHSFVAVAILEHLSEAKIILIVVVVILFVVVVVIVIEFMLRFVTVTITSDFKIKLKKKRKQK